MILLNKPSDVMIKMRYHFLLIFLAFYCSGKAQNNNVSYRSDENPWYWKNHKPHAAYWQQDVHYKIKAYINDNTNILSGKLELMYYNNSPDTLNYVFFHLYQNAYLPGSYNAIMSQKNGYNLTYGNYQKNGLGTVVENLAVNGESHQYQIDNTIMKIDLAHPINPGDSAIFKMDFKTYFNEDAGWGRMCLYKMWGFKHFNGAHWYPRISVYDSRFGWTADQHFVHEFYGDFGTYDVELDFPDNYILEATGMLTNEFEVLPPELRMKIALSNFADKPFGSPPSVIIPYDSTHRKVWKYHAINVHDFAFVASPTYRIGMVMKNGVRCVAVAHESHAAKWQTAPALTADIVDIFSRKIGPYIYPKMVTADAFSGMEYPMLTMNSGTAPDYAYIFSHEMGHNWFFGMVGSNETYRALLDEGFTQYLTVYALQKLSEKWPVESPPDSRYLQKFQKKYSFRDRFAYKRYLKHAVKTEGVQLNTHSDMFETQSPYGEEYRQTYYKTATMLFNLEYVLGEELFDNAIKSYFRQWTCCHPYEEDMRTSFIHASKVDLNWFFDQYINTNKEIDFSVVSVNKDKENGYYNILFKRNGRMQMPVDFTVKDKNDSLLNFHIPNTDFIKKTKSTVLPKWYGWLDFNSDYTARIYSPAGIKNVMIDTSGRLADVYAPDNNLKPNLTCSFDYLINNSEDLHHYEVYYRPDLWWNGTEGIKAGFNINGHYLNHFHIFDAFAWYNSYFLNTYEQAKVAPVSYAVSYNTPLTRYAKKTRIFLDALNAEGVSRYAVRLNFYIKPEGDYFYTELKSVFRNRDRNFDDKFSENLWDSYTVKNPNNMLKLGFNHSYNNPERSGYLNISGTTSFLGTPFDFSKIALCVVNNQKADLLKLRTRLYGQWATGRNMPSESMLYFAGASPEELIESKFTRSVGFFPKDWWGYGPNTNHFHAAGGLNVRGYAGYLVAQENKSGFIVPVYKGHSGASINTELEYDALATVIPDRLRNFIKINAYLFADAGVISVNTLNYSFELSNFRASAGAGWALTINKWGVLSKLKPLTIRFDIPFFLNRPPAIDKDYFNYRWIVGIGRAF